MSNIFKILLIFIIITSCTLSKNVKFWSDEKKPTIKEIEVVEKIKVNRLFNKTNGLDSEFNPNLNISLSNQTISNIGANDQNNNEGRYSYHGDLKKVSRFKFSKNENLFQYSPEILFENDNIIFFDAKGAIFKFDSNSNLIWKKNYYSKSQKKQNPILIFQKDNETLIVADSIGKYYALDINSGKLLWEQKNTSPYNSQIKIYKDKFFITDYENTLRAYSIKNGKEIWKLRTENTLIRSQQKLSIVINKKNIYFNNSLGDISAVNMQTGELLWQRPTLSISSSEGIHNLANSELVLDSKNLYFSNNKNNFYSIDINTGVINWQQTINSSLKPTLVENFIFTVSNNGFLILIDKDSGNIIRATNLFKKQSKKYIRSKKIEDSIQPMGFIVGFKKIYLTTNKGQLYIIDILTGKTTETLKIDSETVSRPYVLNKNLYIIKSNSIIKFN